MNYLRAQGPVSKLVRACIPDWGWPYARAIKWSWRFGQSRLIAGWPSRTPANPTMAFVIGCGRSGTTILGELLSAHPDIDYLVEPWDYWAAVDPRNDSLHLFGDTPSQLIRDAEACDTESRERFRRLFFRRAKEKDRLLIEKTPLNAYRIGYIEALKPGSRYVHIVRDGVEVSRSIARLATKGTYRIAGKRDLNQWWGNRHHRWHLLAMEGARRGYFSDEVGALGDDTQKAAYEWLTSLAEVDRWRDVLGPRLLEIRYESLVRNPRRQLTELCQFLTVTSPDDWLASCDAAITPTTPHAEEDLRLPTAMSNAFNDYQRRYGYARMSLNGKVP